MCRHWLAQHVSDTLHLQSDACSARIPFGQGTFASRITATCGPAVYDAGLQMRERLLDTAATMLGSDSVVLDGNRVTLDGDPEKSVSLLDIVRVANIGKHAA